MHIALITNRLGARPWSTGYPVAPIARALAGRGHRVTLIADSIDDPDLFLDIHTRTFRSYEQTATAFPIRFPSWAAARIREIAPHRTISLTHRVPAPVWFPIDATPRAWVAHKSAAASPVSLAITLARTPGVFLRVPPLGAQRRVMAGNLSPFSLLAPASDPERAAARASIRDLLCIPDGRTLLVLSAPGSLGPRLDPLLTALAELDPAPILAALVRDTFTLERHARTIGGPALLNNLRILTTTLDIRPMLLAADAAITPFRTSLTHRFAADAIRVGTPVLNAQGFRLPVPDESEGWREGSCTQNGWDWLATLRTALTPGSLRAAHHAAVAAGDALSLDRVVDALLSDPPSSGQRPSNNRPA